MEGPSSLSAEPPSSPPKSFKRVEGLELSIPPAPPLPAIRPEESDDHDSPTTPINHHIYRDDSIIGVKVKKPDIIK